ncbi:MAG: hypothetical protein Q9170_007037 [Blastenia crenularia]
MARSSKSSRVLMVGAGGIGCELLKNLVLTGFGEVHIVDLDTIDLSNLNRQFLFRQEHIKKPKALVAKESAGRFNPQVKLEAHHANIKDAQFNVDWFAGFNLVFNALDNLDARRHVNKMCLAADVPLIESGTTGFNGQVQVIVKGKSECYDCNTKETPKSFPVCTIRSTPSQPIHCIVWAKSYLFTEVFGTSEDEVAEFDHTQDSENATEIENLRKEAQALKQIRQSMGSDDFPRKIFEKVFTDDINRLRSMQDMWKTRQPPTALDFDAVSKSSANGGEVGESVAKRAQVTWSLAENFTVFCDSLRRLSRRLQHAQANESNGASTAILSFDKDDDDTLDFVAASANMRSIIFGIQPRSKFDIKRRHGLRVARRQAKQDVLQAQFGYREFSINNEVGTLYDPDLDDNLSKKFSELGVKGDSFLTVIDDDEENPYVNLSLSISEKELAKDSKPLALPTDFQLPRKQLVDSSKVRENGNGVVTPTAPGKRKRTGSLEESTIEGRLPVKRGKVQAPSEEDDFVLVNGANHGAIVIDD